MKPRISEAQHQRAVFAWAAVMSKRYPLLGMMFHVPNGGYRNPREARNLRLQGVKPGVPDIILPIPRGNFHGLFIELKAEGGRLTLDQSNYLISLNNLGYMVKKCIGADDAIETIKAYMGIV